MRLPNQLIKKLETLVQERDGKEEKEEWNDKAYKGLHGFVRIRNFKGRRKRK